MGVATLWYDTKETGQLIIFFLFKARTTFALRNRFDEYDDEGNAYTSAKGPTAIRQERWEMDDIWIPTFSDACSS